MFSYPSSPICLACDNLVSDGHGSSCTMNNSADIGKGEKIVLADILWHCDSILEALGTTSSSSEAMGISSNMPSGSSGLDVCVLSDKRPRCLDAINELLRSSQPTRLRSWIEKALLLNF
jgi:hypothetical protein